MAIYEGSRYATAALDNVADSNGVVHQTVFRTIPGVPNGTTLVLVQEGVRFDTLAARYLGDPELWWQIADANPEVFSPDSIAPGMLIRIPSVAAG